MAHKFTPGPYRPSNGTEGMMFEDKFCSNCIHCNPDPNGEKQCDILTNAVCFEIGEPEYPKEWVYDENGPTCTKWVKSELKNIKNS